MGQEEMSNRHFLIASQKCLLEYVVKDHSIIGLE